MGIDMNAGPDSAFFRKYYVILRDKRLQKHNCYSFERIA